jgi:hypothetical protein
MPLLESQGLYAQIRAGLNAELAHPRCCDGPNTVEPVDRQRSDEVPPIAGVMTNWPFGLR